MDYWRKLAIASNLILLIWFLLDMTGFSIGNSVLVTTAYREDGIFFCIYLIAFLLFIWKYGFWKYILIAWLALWFTTQFYFHWWVTLFGPWEDKMNFFSHTIKLIPSSQIYIPDLYHIVLHLLILVALIFTIVFVRKAEKIPPAVEETGVARER
ncbi:hypothetical protein [Alkalithermobacter paradoxus]|uniref:Uncharacterized protein n=1 Tax=Alkalithermobacter paradoxus TaxID=29349 RepID=A0A1V4I8A8_9FIRM|nr:hypothetical protein CLOTH_10430 [[Clostridium] thermoalcaliphilum]